MITNKSVFRAVLKLTTIKITFFFYPKFKLIVLFRLLNYIKITIEKRNDLSI